MPRGIVLISTIFMLLLMSACSIENSSSEKNIQEGELKISGKSENWEAQALITTKVSVTYQNDGSAIVKPLESKGTIHLTPKFTFEEDIEVEYFLSRFKAEGKEILSRDDSKFTFLFEGGIPYLDNDSTYELTIKWIENGDKKEEILQLKLTGSYRSIKSII